APRALEAARDHDGREHLTVGAERADAQTHRVVRAAPEAVVEAGARHADLDLRERREALREGRAHRRVMGHGRYFRSSGSHAASGRVGLPTTLAWSSQRRSRSPSASHGWAAWRATSSALMNPP